MKNQAEASIVIDGVTYDLVLGGEYSDEERAELGYPSRGAKCSCKRCSCDNEGDVGTLERPICGCCLADCPDVHSEA